MRVLGVLPSITKLTCGIGGIGSELGHISPKNLPSYIVTTYANFVMHLALACPKLCKVGSTRVAPPSYCAKIAKSLTRKPFNVYASQLQRLLDERSQGKSTANSNRASKELDTSSISWAFHETIDTTGVLRWLAENIDATANGLSDDELELLLHIERTEFQYGGAGVGDEDVAPSFELRDRRKQAQARISRLEAYSETVRGQSTLLTGRVNQMTRELEELQAEELALVKAASSTDGEVARLTSMYSGLLSESSLAAQALMDRFQPESLERRYFYQCESEISRLDLALQAHVENIGEQVDAYMESADELPSPWREFEPFATHSMSELLRLAVAEHSRIASGAQKLNKSTLALEIENALVKAIDSEIDKAMRVPGELLQRCQAASLAPSMAEMDADRVIGEHVARLVLSALPDGAALHVQPAVKVALANLNESCNELAQSRSVLLDQRLATLKASLSLPAQTIGAIRHALATEREMLAGWAALWSTVSSSLDRDNAELERQKLGSEERGSDADGDADMPEQSSWLSEGAFTSWEALLADAKASRKLDSSAQQAIVDEVYAAEALERRMNGSRLDLEAALHGGRPNSGTETVHTLPLDVRDMMGELKRQANILRKRVTKATMATVHSNRGMSSEQIASEREAEAASQYERHLEEDTDDVLKLMTRPLDSERQSLAESIIEAASRLMEEHGSPAELRSDTPMQQQPSAFSNPSTLTHEAWHSADSTDDRITKRLVEAGKWTAWESVSLEKNMYSPIKSFIEFVALM
ncbi:hypothetical protein GGI20_002192, partial [Coemansia sp. BCRC 34301]